MAWLDCPFDQFGPLARELLGQGHRVRLPVAGSSMEPLIRDGDRVDIEPAAPEKVAVGDVILFSLGGRLFLHRVIGRRRLAEEICLVARGDHNLRPEPEFGPEALLGVAVELRRGDVVIDLDRRWNRLVGWVMARCWPVQRIVLKVARRWPGLGLPPFLPRLCRLFRVR